MSCNGAYFNVVTLYFVILSGMNEEELDALVICHGCHAVNHKIEIADGAQVHCAQCNGVLYKANSKFLQHSMALAISALLLFLIASTLPMVKIELIGDYQIISLFGVIGVLFDHGFYLLGVATALLIYVFPLLVIILQLAVFTLLKFSRGKTCTQFLLIILAKVLPWNMSEIFLVSVLVALVKLLSYAQIQVGAAFFALVGYVVINLYMNKAINMNELWTLKENTHQA